MIVDDFDALDADAAQARLLECCHATRWAADVAGVRPYGHFAALSDAAAARWRAADEAERLEAFAAHPRIGDVELLRARFSRANVEQGQVLAAPDEIIERLQALNDAYFERFGFIFIVCATGSPPRRCWRSSKRGCTTIDPRSWTTQPSNRGRSCS